MSGMKVEEACASYLVPRVSDAPEWRRTTLGEVADFEMGQAPPGSECNKEGVGTVFVKAGEFGSLYPVEVEWTTKPLKYGKKGDVFICVVGATAGKLNMGIDCAIGRSVAAIRPREGVDTKFIYYQLQPWVLKLRASSSGSAQGVISKAQLNEIPLLVVPFDQQKRIVAEIEKQFSRLDEAVANLKRVKANLKRYKAAVLKAAVEGRLVETEAELARREGRSFETGAQLLQRILETRRSQWKGKGKYKEPAAPDTTDLPELPEGWVWASVEQLGTMGQQAVLTGPFGSNIGKADFQDTGVPVLTIGCLREDGLDISKATFVSESKAEELGRYKLIHGDMLFSRMASVGRAGFVTQEFEGALFNYHIMRLRLEKSAIDPMLFIYYVRGAKIVQDYVREVNHGATRDGINTEQLLNMPVVVPPAPEQHRIVAEVDRRISLIRETEAQVDANLRRAERLRQGVLRRAFVPTVNQLHSRVDSST